MEFGIAIFIIFCLPLLFLYVLTNDERRAKKQIEYFKPGMTLEYYEKKFHGKFAEYRLICEYEILDIDGIYAMVKNARKDDGIKIETNLMLDMKYSDRMVLKDKEGNIIKTYQFEL